MIFQELLSQLNSPEFETLRPMQESVLGKYSTLSSQENQVSNIGIEMPAGTGKTLVELLIGEYHRREGKRVGILAGTKQLANQIGETADILGIPNCIFEGSGSKWSPKRLQQYRKADLIAIMNYWAYFNINPKLVPAEILILDDAHLAENAISGLFSVRICRDENNDLYMDIIKVLKALRPKRYPLIDDILLEVRSNKCLLVPFTDWLKISDQISNLLNEVTQEDCPQIYYPWRFNLREKTDVLSMFITYYEVQIRPIVFPTQSIRHFSEPLRRLFFSATLGDMDDFQRRLGCNQVQLIAPSNPQPGERGRRMIVLFPEREESSDQMATIKKGLRKLWPVARKRLWLCGSFREVSEWQERVPPLRDGSNKHIKVLRGDDEEPLEYFRTATLCHLFTAARYDGIDFPGDQCRLAIIPSPPVTVDPQEEFFSAHLMDARFIKARFSQRIAQALGRCNREAADFAVYLFLDPRFERSFGGNDQDYLVFLPSDIRAEMEAALENCEFGFERCCDKANDFLTGRFSEWDSQVQNLRGQSQNCGAIPESSSVNSEVSGWLAMWMGDPVKAALKFRIYEQVCVEQHISGTLAFSRYYLGWARFLCHILHDDPSGLEDAIKLLEASANAGPSSWFTTTVRACINDLRLSVRKRAISTSIKDSYKEEILHQWDKVLYDRGSKDFSLNKWFDGIGECIKSNDHDKVVEGIYNLGTISGFDPFRPRRQSGMPDVVWRLSSDPKYLFTWEVKAELDSGRQIALRDVNQAHGHGRWASRNYSEQGYKCIPLILSASDEIESDVIDRLDNVRCVCQSTLFCLVEGVRKIFDQYRITWSANDNQRRSEARSRVYATLPNADWLYDSYCTAENGYIPKLSFSIRI